MLLTSSRSFSTGSDWTGAINVVITYVTRQASGNAARRTVEVSGERISLGRGADCGVQLHDPRIFLVHAFIERKDDAFYLAAVSGAELARNGNPTSHARLTPGDRIALGPFDVSVEETPTGKDLALAVELTRPLGNAFEALAARSRMDLVSIGLGKRGWSWFLVAIIVTVFFLVPLLVALERPEQSGTVLARDTAPKATSSLMWSRLLAAADHLWLSGEISSAHRFFAGDCGACHRRPFVQVRDSACLECHRSIEQHANADRFAFASFADTACQRCHKEHNGARPILLSDQRLCVACHAEPDQWKPKSDTGPTVEFDTRHPEFRPSVVVEPTGPVLARAMLSKESPPQERSGLKFPHAKHLDEKGLIHPTQGTVTLDCGDCHTPEPGGLGMEPVRMERNCRQCHALKFDAAAPEREVPHGKPREIWAMLNDFYANVALASPLKSPDREEGDRRLPRSATGLSREEASAALDWARRRAREVAAETVGKRVCATCHTVLPPASDNEPWGIAPVAIADRWMPHAGFTHAKHGLVACGECHAARESRSAQDVLLPAIATCRRCHGGEAANRKVPSTCIACHEFHRTGLAPMRPATGQPN